MESSEERSAGDIQDDYHAVQIEVTEDHLESLKHGSGITYEFDYDDGTLAVHVDSERDLDKDWLLDEQSKDSDVTGRQWRVVAGLTAAMAGMLWAAVPLVHIYLMYVGGLLSVLGGIYVLDQIPGEAEGVSERVE
jgi:hypothetical protein